jgi:hypothetical protein
VGFHDEQGKLLQSQRVLEELNVLEVIIIKHYVSEVLTNLHLFLLYDACTDLDHSYL